MNLNIKNIRSTIGILEKISGKNQKRISGLLLIFLLIVSLYGLFLVIPEFKNKYINGFYSWICYLVGYLYFLLVGSELTKLIIGEIKSEVKFSIFSRLEKPAYAWYAEKVGQFDGILYIVAFVKNNYTFIAMWLAFKLAGRWASAEMESELEKKRIAHFTKNKQRIVHNAIYNIFTLGNALTLIFAFTSSKIIDYLLQFLPVSFLKALFIALIAPFCAFIFYIDVQEQSNRLKNIG